MNNMSKIFSILIFFSCVNIIFAQDFGFGFDEDEEVSKSASVSVNLNGEITVEAAPFFHDFMEETDIRDISLSNVKLNFSITSPYIEFFSLFNFNPESIGELWSASSNLKEYNYTPMIINEVFLRAFIGPVNIEAGFRKLSWGKADSGGPLDITNPADYTDLRNIKDVMGRKIARPMLHVTWNTGDFSKLEGVFIPNFAGHRFSSENRWAPSQITGMKSIAEDGITQIADQKMGPLLSNPFIAPLLPPTMFDDIKNNLFSSFNDPIPFKSTDGIKYFQTGLRYTTTINNFDIGFQYFYGNMFQPGFYIDGIDDFLDDLINNISTGNFVYSGDPSLIKPQVKYSRYHQFGVDYAQNLFGFNLRAEAAYHLTEDYKGDNGSIQNPFIGWALGFDRELFWGISLNMQCNETIRLLNNKVGSNPVLDMEAGADVTSTRLTTQLSKKFFRDNLEINTTVIWGIEDSDCYIIPAIIWISGNLTSELSAGFFAGSKNGELGQYKNNSFIKLGVKYIF